MAVNRDSRIATDSGRFYNIPGIPDPVPSVTTILGVLNKPAIGPWMAKMQKLACIEVAWKLWTKILDKEIDYRQFVSMFESYLGKEKEGDKKKREAAEIGTQAHSWVEWRERKELGLSVGPEPTLSDPAMLAATHYENWRKEVCFRPVRSEQVVWSVKHKFAGTYDILGYACDVLSLCDIKTGKAVYDEVKLQLAAYVMALDEMGLERVSQGIVIRLPKVDTDPDFEAVTVTNLDYHYEAFLHVRAAWQWVYEQEQANKQSKRRK